MILKCVVGRMGGPKASEPEAILSCVVGRLCGFFLMDLVGPSRT